MTTPWNWQCGISKESRILQGVASCAFFLPLNAIINRPNCLYVNSYSANNLMCWKNNLNPSENYSSCTSPFFPHSSWFFMLQLVCKFLFNVKAHRDRKSAFMSSPVLAIEKRPEINRLSGKKCWIGHRIAIIKILAMAINEIWKEWDKKAKRYTEPVVSWIEGWVGNFRAV